MDKLDEIIGHIETHSVEDIRECFANGLNPNTLFRNIPLIYELTSEYARGPKFRECVKAFVDFGLEFEDKLLLAVLLNDSASLEDLIKRNPALLQKKYSLQCAYTPMDQVSLMHICAEFNHLACAEILFHYGADLNARAGKDENGFGTQTPVFHTVNQNRNQSLDMLDFFLSNSVDLQLTVPGLIWGREYDWETLIPAVTPISYAMMGLLPQMHRDERTISAIVTRLLKQAYGIDYLAKNVPCKYLTG